MPSDHVAMRVAYDAMGKRFALPSGGTVRADTLGGVPCEWLVGPKPQHGAVLYLHGGGFSTGSSTSHRHLAAGLALLTGAAVAVLDYRLAPEHPFPAALDDAVSAYGALLEIHPATQLVVAGDSAGGGLAAALMGQILSTGLAAPACAYLISPWVDLADRIERRQGKADADPIVSDQSLSEMAERYAAGGDRGDPRMSPIHADLTGSPPTLIQVGSAEVLLDDAVRLARKLADADAAVRLDVWPHMLHVWPWFHLVLPEGHDALTQAAQFIRSHLD